LVGEIDGLFNFFIRGIFQSNIDLALLFKHAETSRRCIEQMDECGGKDVLAGVLLKMIQPSRPINFTVDRVAYLWRRSLNQVQDTFVFSVDAINDSSFAKRTGIRWLPTACRIKSSAIERYGHLTIIKFAETNDAGIEFEQTRIVVVESFGCAHSVILVSLAAKFKTRLQISQITERSEILGKHSLDDPGMIDLESAICAPARRNDSSLWPDFDSRNLKQT
jgi:hypothetical protein